MSLFDTDPFESALAEIDAPPTPSTGPRRSVYTDGACQGNPGPGGWGWVILGDVWASGAEDPSTNQRMELQAVLHAVTELDGALEIVSDSTYVVNCFKDRWWMGWERRGWKNSQKKEVANQDLWKPLVAAYKVSDVTFRWVKGHSGDEGNEKADHFAVEAAAGRGSDGEIRPLLE
ncbi:MAG: ribonuclease HI [Verrucomicrobiales bacterium]|jgi:ribonuclease HI